MNSSQVQYFLSAVWGDLQSVDVLWQVGIIGVSLSLGWLASRRIESRRGEVPPSPAGEGETGEAVFTGVRALAGIVGPVVALALLYIVRPILAHWHHVNLISLAIPLLGSLALVRALIHLARRAFPKATLIAGFERGIATFIWGAFALHITGVLPELVSFLDGVRIPAGKQQISLWTIVQAVFWVALTVLVALWLGRSIETRVMRAETLHSSLRVALARTVRIVLVFIGVLIALPLLGIDLTLFSVFSGALGVGLGFGLQKIASNYMSGFIILLERSVRIGDLVTIDKYSGEVRGITTRYVILRALDGSEAIIPNETLIAQTVVNHSLSDRLVRIMSRIQVGYGVDPDRALALLVEVAGRHPRVVDVPEPIAQVAEFGDNGVALELGFWVKDPQNGTGNVRSDINLEIWRTFRREGIEIPFPQRDIRLIGDKNPVETANQTG